MNKRTHEFRAAMVAQNPDGYFVAVAEEGPAIRAAFLTRVYQWFFVGILVQAVTAAAGYFVITGMIASDPQMASGIFRFGWIGAIIVWMISSRIFGKMLLDPATEKVALFGNSIVFGVVLSFMTTLAYMIAGPGIILSALILTVIVFGALTAYVMLTKTDFSFLRGALVAGGAIALGLVVMSLMSGALGWGLFGGDIWGYVIPGFFILLMAGSILYTTSEVLHRFPEDRHVAAAGMLATITVLLLLVVAFAWLGAELLGSGAASDGLAGGLGEGSAAVPAPGGAELIGLD